MLGLILLKGCLFTNIDIRNEIKMGNDKVYRFTTPFMLNFECFTVIEGK